MATSDLTNTAPRSAPSPANNRTRWSIAFLLGLDVLINFLDRVNLSVAHDAMRSTLHIGEVAFGYLAGAYNWTYVPANCPSARYWVPVGVAIAPLAILL
jgi:hypothetical protein